MMTAFTRLFGPYPFADYGVVVVDDELECRSRRTACRSSAPTTSTASAASNGWSPTNWPTSGSATASPSREWRHIWLNEGFAKYAEWLWSEVSGGKPARAHAARSWATVAALPQDLRVADPGVRRMFDDRVYERGALTLHALRSALGRRGVLRRCCGSGRPPTATAR